MIEAPEFDKIWDEIKSSIDKQIVLAHNADFDIDCLLKTLDSYNITKPIFKFICTQKLAQEAFQKLFNYRLNDVAAYLEFPLNHHDSISDASICAHIGIKAIPIYKKEFYSYGFNDLTHFIIKERSAEIKDKSLLKSFSAKKINSNLLIPNIENAKPDNPFYNKKIVFTGDLNNISRQEAAIKIQNLGADINTSISKKTEIVIVGNGAGPSKMKKIEELNLQGYNIKLIYEDEFLSIINCAK